jgi:hypothetical protein
MLSSLTKSVLPHRFLDPQRRRFRDRPATKTKSETRTVRLFGFGALLLAGLALLMSAAFRMPSPRPDTAATRGPAAAIAAAQTASALPATDGLAIPDMEETSPVEKRPEPIIATIDKGCAAHAREKLMVGLTHYYLQRRLRPGASSDDAADTSSLTGVLAGPGDPVAMTPETSCKG